MTVTWRMMSLENLHSAYVEAGGDKDRKILGFALIPSENDGECVIYTTPEPALKTIMHELQHCQEGRFHE